MIRKYPVTRISVNPQTMQQKTLDLVGRKHTVEDVEQIFHLARELGFDNINMDLIAGLPGEDAADMQDTLEKIEKLHPDSLTVHALAIKRAAKFGQEGRTMDPGTEITQMVEAAAASAERMGACHITCIARRILPETLRMSDMQRRTRLGCITF